MSKEPTTSRLLHDRHDDATLRAAALTVADYGRDAEDVAQLLDALGMADDLAAPEPEPKPELTVIEPCPEEAASLNGHRRHKLAGESCETCKAAAREYHRTYGQRHRAQRNEASRRYRARLRFER